MAETITHLESIIFSSTPDGKKYYFITPAIEKMVGISAEDAIKIPFFLLRLIVPEDFVRFRNFVSDLRKGKPLTIEYRIKNFRGELLHLRHSAFPVFEDGELVRIDGIVYDITKEKENELRLKASEERLRTLIETAEDFIFVLGENGAFLSVNTNGALNLEYHPEEMIGKHFLEFIEESYRTEVAKSFQEILRSNKVVSFDAHFISKYGKSIIFEINAKTTSEGDKLTGVLGIGRNITIKRMEQEKMRDLNNKLIEANRIISIERDRAKQKISILEELNRLKNEFVSNISHELRTPLASIIGFSETIQSDPHMPEAMRMEFNQIILNEATRLAKLINDVLDISKIEEGKIELVKEEFNLVETVKSIAEQFKDKIEGKGLAFWYEVPKHSVTIYADKERIQQVFENILSNAVKFTENGRITLLAQNLYKEFEVIITDTGLGIPKKDMPFIFQKFYRVSRPGSEIPGTGLGLALVKQIVDLHKGYISILSEENKGTTVVIKLPILKQE